MSLGTTWDAVVHGAMGAIRFKVVGSSIVNFRRFNHMFGPTIFFIHRCCPMSTEVAGDEQKSTKRSCDFPFLRHMISRRPISQLDCAMLGGSFHSLTVSLVVFSRSV